MSKICKGIGKAKDFQGCGIEHKMRRFGLCPSCLYEWATTTENGRIWHKSQFLPKVKKNVERTKKDKSLADKRRMEFELLSPNKYRELYLQPKVNLICRLIDAGHPCIANGTFGKENAGHFYSVQSNLTIALNLHNVHIQSFKSNHWDSGDIIKYRSGLIRVYGIEYLEFVESLKRCPPLNLTKEEMRDIAKTASQEILRLKKLEIHLLSPKERIALRNEINDTLGIYPKEFSEFKT